MTHLLSGNVDELGEHAVPALADAQIRPAAFGLGQSDVVELPAIPASPEAALLLACLRWPVSAEMRMRVASLARADLDWALFAALVVRHRVFGLVEHALRSAGVTIPEPQRAALCDRAQRTSWSELIMAGELRAIQDDLRVGGVQPTILKGLALSIKAYGRLGLRYNRDIDLLVPWSDVKTACAAAMNGSSRLPRPGRPSWSAGCGGRRISSTSMPPRSWWWKSIGGYLIIRICCASRITAGVTRSRSRPISRSKRCRPIWT
jgi:hypothetical protein